MLIIIVLLLIIIGMWGFFNSLYKHYRKQRIIQVLESNVDTSKNEFFSSSLNKAKEAKAIEKILLKTNKMVFVTNMLDKNIIIKVYAFITVTMGLYVVDFIGLMTTTKNTKIIILLFAAIVIVILPERIKNIIIQKRVRRVSTDIPFIIDMMAVCVQSGMTIEYALKYLSENTDNINPEIAALLERVMIKNEVSGISDALNLMYSEVPCNEMRMLCTTLQQSIKYGSSIYLILMDLSKDIREMQLLNIEEKISGLAAKMSLPMMLFIMFPILIMVGAPGAIRIVMLWG